MSELQNADKILEVEATVSVLTKGASMRPMLREHRDMAVIERLERKPKVNDVLLYRKKGYDKLILHRLIKVKKDKYIIRGDNNYFTEYDVRDEDIVGVLKEFYRDGKYYNCKISKKYLLYSFYIRHSYPLRYFYKKILYKCYRILLYNWLYFIYKHTLRKIIKGKKREGSK